MNAINNQNLSYSNFFDLGILIVIVLSFNRKEINQILHFNQIKPINSINMCVFRLQQVISIKNGVLQ